MSPDAPTTEPRDHGLATQHRQLGRFAEEITLALERGNRLRAGEVLRWFRSALEAHFTVEEKIIFTAVAALDPGLELAFAKLRAEHVAFRLHLTQVDRVVETSEPARALVVLSEFYKQLRDHERREEKLVGADRGRGS